MNQLVPISSPTLPALVAAVSEPVPAVAREGWQTPRGRAITTSEEYLIGYLDGAGLRGDPKLPLFRTIGRGTGKLTRTVLPQANAYAMIGRRAAAAGIATKLGNHSFQATGITAYLKIVI